MTWMDRLRGGLSKTRLQLQNGFNFLGKGKENDESALEELEMALLSADVGGAATADILKKVGDGGDDPMATLATALVDELTPEGGVPERKGNVIMLVGVNGVGKTTTVAKLGQHYMEEGKSVIFGAGDTFRAAAGTQLEIWAERLGTRVIGEDDTIKGAPAVGFAAAAIRQSRNIDILLLDTAGRLHNQHNLMRELQNVHSAIKKIDENEPAEVWMVIDAVTGQNGLQQAKKFNEFVPLTGVVVTKLDGTARGGILVPIVRELGVPIRFIGVGEQVEDLQPFNPEQFVEALLD